MSTQTTTRIVGTFILAIVFCVTVMGGAADMSYDMDYFHGGDVQASTVLNVNANNA